ncbi:MAG: glycosyltransferase family 4 protein [Bacteroidales bacterium]|nr:glycosyltransferase family 4 protein [Bacteroidales bacterium]MCM1146231.1 glycosyltransferase family 4 protein [Bacteroidales bacterium]MCM1205331.1 glycosyltransferase family 4 protein [Bacillota bacterium]MCM1509582.1 glycosyltransferase family 4 protein [Clostridium sp.]
MKVALHTVDLFPGRERLMPFRTLLEVAKVMNCHGWEAEVVNSSVSMKGAEDFEWQGVCVRQCPRDFRQLSRWVNDRGFDAFFFAATIREGLRSVDGFNEMKCRKIAYVPSGITPKQNALWLMRMYGLFAKAWVLEAFTPKSWIVRKLHKAGFSDVIGLTEYTTDRLGDSLSPHTVYPGKDGFEDMEPDFSIVAKHGLQNKKFFLFTGAPGEVRGSQVLLKAFDKLADSHSDARIVFLMRNDVGAQYDAFFKALNGLMHKENVMVLRESLTVPQLKAFMMEAYAVVLPFICIPAEVPITYYEVMSCGTPVVSFPNAGTTDYLKDGLKITDGLGVKPLAKALRELWCSPEERAVLGKQAAGIMERHPAWEQVGQEWMDVIQNGI